MANGLFGPTPAQVQQAMADERLARAQLLSNLPLGSGGAIAGQLFGTAVNNALGIQDPRLREAQAMQEVQAEVEALGATPGTQRFTQAVTEGFQRRGLGDMAIRANTQARQLEKQDLEVQKLRQETRPQGLDPIALQFRADALQAANVNPAIANAALLDEKLFRSVIQEATKDRSTDLMRNFDAVRSNPAFGDWIDRRDKNKATSIKVSNFYTKPLGNDASNWRDRDGNQASAGDTPAEAAQKGFQPLTKERQAQLTQQVKAATGKQISIEQAGPVLQAYTELLRSGGIKDIGELKQLEGAAAFALARLRDPTGRLTDAEVDLAKRDLPGLISRATGQLEGRIRGLQTETGVQLAPQQAGDLKDVDQMTEEELLRELNSGG